MSLSLIDLLLVAVVTWLLWKFINKKSKAKSNPNLSEDGNILTDTQIHFRKQMAIVKAENNALEINDQIDQFTTEHEKTIAIIKYVNENMRPFNLLEWIMHPLDSRLCIRYILAMITLFVMTLIIPLYVGLPILTITLGIAIIVYDFLTYREQRLLEVTVWNPEFCKKFNKD